MTPERDMPDDPVEETDAPKVEFFFADGRDEDGNVYPVTFHEVTSSIGPTRATKVPWEELVNEDGSMIDLYAKDED